MNPRNARILLTGAAGGIGSAIAARLASSGAALLLTDVRAEPLEKLAARLAERGVAADHLAADVTSEQGRQVLVARARANGVDVLINAAGINPFGLFAGQRPDDVGKTLLINTLAPLLLVQAMLPVLAERDAAHIVNIGSTFGSIGFPGFSVYSASKFAVRGFSEALRRELADTSIHVHYVAPRATRTALATDRIRAMNEELKVGMDPPETVARAVEDVLRREDRERLLGVPERLFAKLNALFPGLVDRSLRKQLSVIKRYATADSPRAAVPPPIDLKELDHAR